MVAVYEIITNTQKIPLIKYGGCGAKATILALKHRTGKNVFPLSSSPNPGGGGVLP